MYAVLPNQRLRGFSDEQSLDIHKEIGVSQDGILLLAEGLPPFSETTRLGRGFIVRTTTAAAPVAAIPTTTAMLALQNNEPEDGSFYAITEVFAIVVAAGASTTLTIVGQLSQTPRTVITQAFTPRPYTGGTEATAWTLANAQSAYNMSNFAAWQALGNSYVNTANIGAANVGFLQGGRIIIPPGGFVFGISAIMGDTASSTVLLGIKWVEIRLSLGSGG